MVDRKTSWVVSFFVLFGVMALVGFVVLLKGRDESLSDRWIDLGKLMKSRPDAPSDRRAKLSQSLLKLPRSLPSDEEVPRRAIPEFTPQGVLHDIPDRPTDRRPGAHFGLRQRPGRSGPPARSSFLYSGFCLPLSGVERILFRQVLTRTGVNRIIVNSRLFYPL